MPPQPLTQHFSWAGHWLSLEHVSAQVPIAPGATSGQLPDFSEMGSRGIHDDLSNVAHHIGNRRRRRALLIEC